MSPSVAVLLLEPSLLRGSGSIRLEPGQVGERLGKPHYGPCKCESAFDIEDVIVVVVVVSFPPVKL